MIQSRAGEISSDGGRTVAVEAGNQTPRDEGGLSLGVSKPNQIGGGGGLSPMAQATIQKHLSGPSKRILLSQSANKKTQAKDAGTITGN